MDKIIAWTVTTFNVSRIFFGFDEMRGFNRDSRSRAANLTNAESLAKAVNALQAAMTKADPNAGRAMIWGDMLSPWHNGARPEYQLGFGGVKGATYLAMPLLDERIQIVSDPHTPLSTLMPSHYSCTKVPSCG